MPEIWYFWNIICHKHIAVEIHEIVLDENTNGRKNKKKAFFCFFCHFLFCKPLKWEILICFFTLLTFLIQET